MSDIKLLDCTLRDGGYVVDGKFGEQRIRGIIAKLVNAHVDIIECGFLRRTDHKSGESVFQFPAEAENYLPPQNADRADYALMYDAGRYNVSELPPYTGGAMRGVRDCFHKNFLEQAMQDAEMLVQKGYRTYIQPTGIVGYTKEELLRLIERVNRIHPYSFSLVDTFGSLYKDDVVQLTDIVAENLDPEIYMGFHSHNNLQLSFALTQDFIDRCAAKGRNIIVDSTLYGMGRGAGNTNTELLMDFLNRKYHKEYNIDEVLDLLDIYLKSYIQKQEWGYTIPYFIAGKYSSHVDNINYLLDKGNIQAKDIRQIISEMTREERKHYHADILERLYVQHIAAVGNRTKEANADSTLRELFAGKEILLIAPGKSVDSKRKDILRFIEEHANVVTVTLNFLDDELAKLAFFGNIKRYEVWKQIGGESFERTFKIVTSNLDVEEQNNQISVPQAELIKRGWKYFDLSSMMALRMFAGVGAAKVYLAGMDGFCKGQADEQFTEIMNRYLPRSEYARIDRETKEMIHDFVRENKKMPLTFITPSVYEAALCADEQKTMKLVLGCDKNAYALKEKVKQYLTGKNIEVLDVGIHSPEEETLYPDIAFSAAERIKDGTCERGILICGTGIGMAIAANKVPGIYAAVCHDLYSAQRARKSNNVQIMTMGAQIIGEELAKQLVDVWLSCEFESGRSLPKIERIEEYERKYLNEKPGSALAHANNDTAETKGTADP